MALIAWLVVIAALCLATLVLMSLWRSPSEREVKRMRRANRYMS